MKDKKNFSLGFLLGSLYATGLLGITDYVCENIDQNRSAQVTSEDREYASILEEPNLTPYEFRLESVGGYK